MQQLVARRARRQPPGTAARAELLVPLVLVLAKLAARGLARLLAQDLEPSREASAVDVLDGARAATRRDERVIVSRRHVADLAEGPAVVHGPRRRLDDELLAGRCGLVRRSAHRRRPDVHFLLGLVRVVHGPRDTP